MHFCYYILKDRLGLQEMDKAGKLHFLEAIGNHLQFTDEFFEEKILPFLKEQNTTFYRKN